MGGGYPQYSSATVVGTGSFESPRGRNHSRDGGGERGRGGGRYEIEEDFSTPRTSRGNMIRVRVRDRVRVTPHDQR